MLRLIVNSLPPRKKASLKLAKQPGPSLTGFLPPLKWRRRAPQLSFCLSVFMILVGLPVYAQESATSSDIYNDKQTPGLAAFMHSIGGSLYGCAPQNSAGTQSLNQDFSATTDCLLDRSLSSLLNVTEEMLNKRGKTVFGEGFHIDSSFGYSFSSRGGVQGDINMVLPVYSFAGADDSAAAHSVFLQNGLTRWMDDYGTLHNDVRTGIVYRTALKRERVNVFGISAFLQENLERKHQRFVMGFDYVGAWGAASLSYFKPMTSWQLNTELLSQNEDSAPSFLGERPLKGFELDTSFKPTTTITLNASIGRWEGREDFNTWATSGRIRLAWQPHSYLGLNVAWRDIGLTEDGLVVQAEIRIPIGGRKSTQPRWQGLGLVARNKIQASDIWRKVSNVGRIEYTKRSFETTRTAGVPVGAKVRFLQTDADSGQAIKVEVTLPAPATEDVHILIELIPGEGDNSAVPDVDYVDEPVGVLIRRGESRAVVSIDLLHNPEMTVSKTLKVKLAKASG